MNVGVVPCCDESQVSVGSPAEQPKLRIGSTQSIRIVDIKRNRLMSVAGWCDGTEWSGGVSSNREIVPVKIRRDL